jgi:hypothetical protein
MLPKALRCVSEAINAAGNIETFLAEPTHTRENKEGEPGVRFENVSRGWAGPVLRVASRSAVFRCETAPAGACACALP